MDVYISYQCMNRTNCWIEYEALCSLISSMVYLKALFPYSGGSGVLACFLVFFFLFGWGFFGFLVFDFF